MAGIRSTRNQFDSYVKENLCKQRYRNQAKTHTDIQLVFKTFRDLRPKVDTYTFNDGSQRELLCIEGTIPVLYKGNTYNIPICIWLMVTHPDNPPLCFVKPTQDMLIKPSQYVDTNGRIYVPYLHDWSYPSSDLIGLLQVMMATFGERSPLFSRRSAASARGKVTNSTNTTEERLPNDTSGASMNDRRDKEALQREATELRSRLRSIELRLEERDTNRQTPHGDGGDNCCTVCRRPNEVEFHCGHGTCRQCGTLLNYCPVCAKPK